MTPTRIAALAAAAFALPFAVQAEPAAQAEQCLAEAVYFEARGTSPKSQQAVAHVVLNRAEDPDFPDTVCDVVTDGCQFSYMCDGKPETLAEPEDREAAYEAAGAALEGADDPTGGALFFHNKAVRPGWTARQTRTAEIGGHVFYR